MVTIVTIARSGSSPLKPAPYRGLMGVVTIVTIYYYIYMYKERRERESAGGAGRHTRRVCV